MLRDCNRFQQNAQLRTFWPKNGQKVGLALRLSADDKDDIFLAEVLHRNYEDGGFTVVAPMTTISTLVRKESSNKTDKWKYIVKNLKIKGYNIVPLLEKLIRRNKKSVKISLKSSPEDGYIIDSNGRFRKYFKKDGGGWEKWYLENPKAHGYTRISLPVHDVKSGIILVYKGTQSHWLNGAGYLIAYTYEGENIKELGRVILWIS